MGGPICDVCGGLGLGVAASPLGPVSYAYCRDCLKAKAEPYGSLVAFLAQEGGLDAIPVEGFPVTDGAGKVVGRFRARPWVEQVIEVSLARGHPKMTREQLDKDVAEAIKEFDDYCQKTQFACDEAGGDSDHERDRALERDRELPEVEYSGGQEEATS